MLLAIDVGNTNSVIGVFEGKKLLEHWRLETDARRTHDEYGILLRQLFAWGGLEASGTFDANRCLWVRASRPACPSTATIHGKSAPIASSTRWPLTTSTTKPWWWSISGRRPHSTR